MYPSSPASSSSSISSTQSPRRPNQDEIAPFLSTLRLILELESPEIFRWNCDGTAFEIHDMTRFSITILPKYFNHCKYSSFQRQLNYFHFKKWTKRHAKVCTFSNSYFTRDQPALSRQITRKRSIGSPKTSPRKKVSSEYELDWLLDFDFLATCLPLESEPWL